MALSPQKEIRSPSPRCVCPAYRSVFDVLRHKSFQLRDLFSVNATTPCSTHELIGCRCVSGTIDGVEPEVAADESNQEDESNESEIEDWDAPEEGQSGFMPASQYKPPKENKRPVRASYVTISFLHSDMLTATYLEDKTGCTIRLERMDPRPLRESIFRGVHP